MKAISAELRSVGRFKGALVKGVSSFAMLPIMVMVWTAAEANTTSGTVDPSAPLDILRTARQTAASSNMNVASASTTGANVLNLAIIFFAVAGVVCSGISGQRLYKNIQEGDQARGSNFNYIMALVLGALMTILSVIVGVITNFVTGSGAT